MSGSFRLTYGGDTTGLINAAAEAVTVRDALEALPSITTCAVSRDESRRALAAGTLDAVQGQGHVTCSAGSASLKIMSCGAANDGSSTRQTEDKNAGSRP